MAEGTPTLKMAEMLSARGMPALGEKVTAAPRPIRTRTAAKKRKATQLERQVASPAPSTSCPSGRRTNMNSGSRAMFKTPPRMMPALASRERPMLHIRLESTLESTVGTPPTTMTHRAYCRAYS